MKPLNGFFKLIICTLLFVPLFYEQEPGFNCGLFCLIVWILSYIGLNKEQTGRPFWLISLAILISVGAFTYYGDAVSFLALFISMYVLGFYLTSGKFNPLIYPLLFAYSLGTFIVRVFFFKKWIPPFKLNMRHGRKLISLIVVPLCIISLFLIIYTASSDLFANLFFKIHLGFDLWLVILYLVLGFYFMFNYWFVLPHNMLMQVNNLMNEGLNTTGDFSGKANAPYFWDANFNRRGGEITLIALNLLLVFFLFIYNYEQYAQIKANINLSDEIHQRINTIILSIIMAIGVIMLYFRSGYNKDPKAGILKKLALCWLCLNVLLIISAVLKNAEYIAHFGLTFKRIGVYIFLILSIIGLYYTFHRIIRARTNIYLLSSMMKVFFIALVVNCTVNWSWVITKYNLSYLEKPDLSYLKSLDYNKRILYNTFGRDAQWVDYFASQKIKTDFNKRQPFLSRNLYYELLDPIE
ncbi:MAG TPA: DUF4153 domain-containing protein [Arachidicoccus sp.]|nr:DUF4153 domain-containing protein [Arachidicoccus sp.]